MGVQHKHIILSQYMIFTSCYLRSEKSCVWLVDSHFHFEDKARGSSQCLGGGLGLLALGVAAYLRLGQGHRGGGVGHAEFAFDP